MSKGRYNKKAPKQYVQNLFDDYAMRFDHHLTEILDYKVLEILRKLLQTQLGSHFSVDTVIYLGCGTGLSGQAFRPICRRLVGIDLFPQMIKKAQEKGVDDTIENIEINKYLEQNSEKYDLFIAADVFVYIGDLSQLFSRVAGASRLGEIFLFSIELTLDGDYVLQQSRRYAHSNSYIWQLAMLNKFKILNIENAVLRTEKAKDVEGQSFILRYVG